MYCLYNCSYIKCVCICHIYINCLHYIFSYTYAVKPELASDIVKHIQQEIRKRDCWFLRKPDKQTHPSPGLAPFEKRGERTGENR